MKFDKYDTKTISSDCEISSKSSVDDISKFDKWVYTILLCYANLSYGIVITVISPALMDFTCILDVDPEIVTHFYSLYSMGTLCGSLFGFLFKYINRQLTLIITLLLYGLVTTLLPISPNFPVMYLFGFISGIGSGVLDVVQTVWLIEMWDESGSVLQLSEFAYGIGITVGPLIIAPYLAGDDDCLDLTIPMNETVNYSEKLLPPFIITGSLEILGAVLLLLMYVFRRYIPTESEEKELIQKEIEESLKPIENQYHRRYTVSVVEERNTDFDGGFKGRETRYSVRVVKRSRADSNRFHTLPKRKKFSTFQVPEQPSEEPTHSKLPGRLMLGFGALCFATILVAETAFLDYSPTFFRYYTDARGNEAAILLAVATGAYTITRFAGIYIAYRVKPEHILTLHYAIVSCSIVILWFADDSETIKWIGNVLFGIGISAFWSATFSYIETYFEITDRVGTIYVSLLGLLEIVTQFIEGPFLDKSPEVLLYYLATLTAISFLCFLIIRFIVFKAHIQPYEDSVSDEKSVVSNMSRNTSTMSFNDTLGVQKILPLSVGA